MPFGRQAQIGPFAVIFIEICAYMGMVLRNIIFDTQILIERDRGVDPVRIIVIASGKHASEQQASIKEILSHII